MGDFSSNKFYKLKTKGKFLRSQWNGILIVGTIQRFVSGNFKFEHIFSVWWVILGRMFILPQLLEGNT